MMKGPSGYRLSPNEEAKLLKETREALRKQRLVQVRQQAKDNAAYIRNSVKAEKNKQLYKLAKQIQNEFDKEKEEKLRSLGELYEHSVNHVGEGHASAIHEESKEDNSSVIAEVDKRRAHIRHQNALQKLHYENAKKEEEENRHIVARQAALDAEKVRASDVAAKPPVPRDPVATLEIPKVRPIKFTDLNAFSTTHYHIPELCYVEKAAPQEKVDAKELAEIENEKLTDLHEELKRSAHEQQEKARLRHNHALRKELLKNDYTDMLHDLSDLQRSDKHRRQQVVAKIPKQIFVPPHRRLEEKEETQREMEGKFEDMYMNATEFQGDLSLALDPHPPPETPTCTESLDLSVLDPDTTITAEGQDTTELSGSPAVATATKDATNKSDLMSRKNTPDGLRRLMSRIKTQRTEWAQNSLRSRDDVDMPAKPSPAMKASLSTEPSPSQHPMTDSSPSTAADTASVTTGTLSTVTPSQKTPSTITSGSEITEESRTITDSTVDTESVAVTSHVGDSSLSSVTYAKQYGLNNDQTLLHPMEHAARIRQEASSQGDLSAYLAAERQRHADSQAQWQREAEHIRQETLHSQRQLQDQKFLLETKMQNIQRQRELLMSKLSTSRGRDSSNSQYLSMSSLPLSQTEVVQPYPVSLPQPELAHQFPQSALPFSSDAAIGRQPVVPSRTYNYPGNIATSELPGSGFGQASYPTNGGIQYDSTGLSIPSDLHKARLESLQQYQQQLSDNHQFQGMSESRREMADRAEELLHMTDKVLANTKYAWNQTNKQNSVISEIDKGTQELLHRTGQDSSKDKFVRTPNIGHFSDVEFSEHTMTTTSSGQSRDRMSIDRVTRERLSEPAEDAYEAQSSLPPSDDLGFRFDALENRLRKAQDVLVVPEQPTAPPGGELSKSKEEDSFDLHRKELQIQLAEIERQKAEILEREQAQRNELLNLKNTWYEITPESEDSRLPEANSRENETSNGAQPETSSMADRMRKHLSFTDSNPDYSSLRNDQTPLGSNLVGSGAKEPSFSTLGQHFESLPKKVSQPKEQFVLYHPQEVMRGAMEPRNIDFTSVVPPAHQSFKSTVRPAYSYAENTAEAPVKSSRTWHLELLECSTSSENSSLKSIPKKLPTPPVADREPLVFEIEGPASPPSLRRRFNDNNDSVHFSSTPVKREIVEPKMSGILSSGVENQDNLLSGSSLPTPGSDLSSVQARSDRLSGVHRLSQQNMETPSTVNQSDLHNSDFSQYSLSTNKTGNVSSQKFISPMSDFSQHTMGQSMTSDLSNRGPNVDESAWGTNLPLASIPEMSDVSQPIGSVDKSIPDGATWQEVKRSELDQERLAEMNIDDDIARRVEESLARHRQLMNENRQISEKPRSGDIHQDSTDYQNEQQLSGSDLREQTGISDEPEISLVSLDSTMAENKDDTLRADHHDDSDDDQRDYSQPPVSMATIPVSWANPPVSMATIPVSMATGRQMPSEVASGVGMGTIPVSMATDQEMTPVVSSGIGMGSGARPKDVKFEILEDAEGAGGFMTLEPDSEDLSQSGSDIANIPVQHIEGESSDEYQGLSLQEAFMKKKQDFIQASKTRKKHAGHKVKQTSSSGHPATLGKTLANWKKSRQLNTQAAKGPSKMPDPTNIVERTSEHRKQAEKDMKARTSRLYNRLDEVKQKKVEDDRKKFYAQNREKAKAYHEKLDAKRKKNS